MPNYKFTLHSNQSFAAEDKRSLDELSADLCSAGFVIVERPVSAYSPDLKPVSLLERAIASIEPLD